MRRGFASPQPQRWRLFSQCLDESLVQVGALDLQSMPRLRRPHSARETRFDCELFVFSAQMSVPAGPEGSFCVPVHATRPTEPLRVQTRRPARVSDTSGFICMERPFLCGERALAVERTNKRLMVIFR